ncbi:membrane protein [Streptococcus suis]|uniref:DUF2500 domain-containing protein n=1 Tax=Streptococcus suis TaxID=1307 RepID=UPI0005CE611D|nr:DUF2500 domain-containing protein [Streptococcus suis]NQI18542.1 DUF2500 domain-containing protein [Streptococcus suis]NQO66273.1 DUF2500 domain-containing protein [Streptococcus suis]NQP27142.1 DUF2500 domain-containing protein [Streptococcus suis]NQP38175.1 DUF2500 domain-containing protein [Streptococcus suis]CYU46729.1 membrane protein [Streptococcus suis]
MFENLFDPDGSLVWHTVLFYSFSAIILAIVCFHIIKNFMEWHHNNRAPKESCKAKLVSKRTHVFGNEVARTNYYVTFEWEGKRQEFRLRSDEYALLAEGDVGTLHFQGTRFLGFERL